MRTLLRWSFCCAFVAVLLNADFTDAQNKKQRRRMKTAYLDARSAGPDFAVQGEYVGKIGTGGRLGAQVIALGDGRFDAVLYAGGLPGAGWDGKAPVPLKGKRDGKTTNFKGKSVSGVIVGRIFEGTAADGGSFRLEKTLRKSPTLGAKPPADAVVLFDGSNVDQWEDGKIEAGKLLGVSVRRGPRTKKKFRDFTLHVEFRTPFMPYARGQARGNSGMYLADQYECQILDSFGLTGETNECGGIYKVAKPKVNMCLPPLSWQTYDVEFTAAKFNKQGKRTAPAVATIKHNGVVIHKDRKLKVTPGGHQSDEKPGRLFFQNHGNPVRFRNIWIVER
ncbi:MAG: DUF1080 domain-containing protein [Planctomycetaceae bacterium]